MQRPLQMMVVWCQPCPTLPLACAQSRPDAPDGVAKRWVQQHPGEKRSFLPNSMPHIVPLVLAGSLTLQLLCRLWKYPSPHGIALLVCRCPSRTTTATAACLCAATPSSSRTSCRRVGASRHACQTTCNSHTRWLRSCVGCSLSRCLPVHVMAASPSLRINGLVFPMSLCSHPGQ